MLLTDVELSIISIVLESDKPLTSYKIANRLNPKTYPQNIEHRLDKLCNLGILKLAPEEAKRKYIVHEVLTCDDCLKKIAKHVGKLAYLIEEHGAVESIGITTILDFIVHRTTFIKAGEDYQNGDVHYAE